MIHWPEISGEADSCPFPIMLGCSVMSGVTTQPFREYQYGGGNNKAQSQIEIWQIGNAHCCHICHKWYLMSQSDTQCKPGIRELFLSVLSPSDYHNSGHSHYLLHWHPPHPQQADFYWTAFAHEDKTQMRQCERARLWTLVHLLELCSWKQQKLAKFSSKRGLRDVV
jgi:hypothetical protein